MTCLKELSLPCPSVDTIFDTMFVFVRFFINQAAPPQVNPGHSFDFVYFEPYLEKWVFKMYVPNQMMLACVDPEGVTGGPDPLKTHKNIGFLSNIGPDPL